MILFEDRTTGKRVVEWQGKLHLCFLVYEDDEKEAWTLGEKIIWRKKLTNQQLIKNGKQKTGNYYH